MEKQSPEVHSFFDEATNAACYIVKDPASNACAVIDSILDFDQAAGRTHTTHADGLIAKIRENGWELEWIVETHVHADHLSAAPYLAKELGGRIAIGANIAAVQEVFGKIFNAGTEFEMDGSQFDRLFQDNDRFSIGTLNVDVMHTPGHTPACVIPAAQLIDLYRPAEQRKALAVMHLRVTSSDLPICSILPISEH